MALIPAACTSNDVPMLTLVECNYLQFLSSQTQDYAAPSMTLNPSPDVSRLYLLCSPPACMQYARLENFIVLLLAFVINLFVIGIFAHAFEGTNPDSVGGTVVLRADAKLSYYRGAACQPHQDAWQRLLCTNSMHSIYQAYPLLPATSLYSACAWNEFSTTGCMHPLPALAGWPGVSW